MYELVLDDRAATDTVAPVPDPGATGPVLLADDWHVVLAYRAAAGQDDPRWTPLDGAGVAVCVFGFTAGLFFGGPNDEGLSKHPLYGRGLSFYGVHRVEPSSWMLQLARVLVRGGEVPAEWRHYAITMHDSLFEVVCESVSAELTDGTPTQAAITTLERLRRH